MTPGYCTENWKAQLPLTHRVGEDNDLFLNSIICWKIQYYHPWRKTDVSLIQSLIWAAICFKVCQTLSYSTLLIKHSIVDQKRVSHQFLLKMSHVKQHINLLCCLVRVTPYPPAKKKKEILPDHSNYWSSLLMLRSTGYAVPMWCPWQQTTICSSYSSIFTVSRVTLSSASRKRTM